MKWGVFAGAVPAAAARLAGGKGLCLAAAAMLLLAQAVVNAGGRAESAASSTRGRYLAGQGVIVPPDEVRVDSYIASIDYHYPNPADDVGVTLYTGHQQYSTRGQEGVIQIGVQARRKAYADLPPMNLAFVIDKSSSMSEEHKLDWVKEAFDIFIRQVRDKDFVSLVTFDDKATVLFRSTQMSTPERRQRFREAVQAIYAGGGSDLQAGLELGYEQVLANFRGDYVNRVLFLSDGTEMSARLRGAGAKSGDVRVSLLWNNRNDLDLHVIPPSGEKIFYGHKISRCRGALDVDMNVRGDTTKPVENVFWPQGGAPAGHYRVLVHGYTNHEKNAAATSFTIELMNKGEMSTYEGKVQEFGGSAAAVPVCEFDLRSEAARSKELSTLDGLARQYSDLGIGVSTIGIGVGFDLELMENLAKAGGGSSRFIADRRAMEETFGTDLDRMVVPGARDVDLKLELLPEAQIIGTWGYNHRIEGTTVTYRMPTLYTRDYETILVHFRTVPKGPPGRRTLARLSVAYTDLAGMRRSKEPQSLNVSFVDGDTPVNGFSDGVVLQSGTMLHFARSLVEIGGIYYGCRDDVARGGSDAEIEGRLKTAQEKAREMKKELANAKLRLESKAFDDEIGIMDKYIEILGKDLVQPADQVVRQRADTEIVPKTEERPVEERLRGLFQEMALGMQSKAGVIAVSGFATRSGKPCAFVNLLDEMALVEVGRAERLRPIERKSLDAVLQEQQLALSDLMDTSKAIRLGRFLSANYLVTGSVVEMDRTVIVFGRIINVETSEIESVAQVIVPKAKDVQRLLL